MTAAALSPFPSAEGTYYPGLRRPLTREDKTAWRYVERSVRAVAPFVGRAFGVAAFDLLAASFSIVTSLPATLSPVQRIPHFDSANPKVLAMLHYLGGTTGTGTAFYRQRSTGIEMVDEENRAAFIAAASPASASATGYINASDNHFEQIAFVPAKPDRLVVYQSALLHSGIIPADLPFSADPSVGRLTANFFLELADRHQ